MISDYQHKIPMVVSAIFFCFHLLMMPCLPLISVAPPRHGQPYERQLADRDRASAVERPGEN